MKPIVSTGSTIALRLLVAVALACSLVAAPLPALAPFGAAPEQAYAGPAEYLVTKLADEAIDFADSAIVSTLDYAAEKTGYGIFTKAADLLTLPSGKGDRELEKLCHEILDELAVVDEDIKNLGDQLTSDILRLESLISTNQWATDRRTLTELAQKYTDAYNDYQHYLQAAADYSTAKEAGDPNLAALETRMQGFLENFVDKFDPTKVGDPISFASDIRKLASVCCKAYPSYNVAADAENLPQLYLLQEANTVCDQTQAFEHQKFETLSAQANECMAAFARLAYVNRLWVDYQASVAPDKKAPAKYLTEQETVANEVVQAVNDLAAQMQGYAGNLMRPYDFEIAVDMGGLDTGGVTHMYGHYLVYSRPHDLQLSSYWSKPTMNAYQGKPIGRSTPFLLMKADHGALVHDNLIAYERETEATQRGKNFWDYSSMNQDWYTLFMSHDSNYTLISDPSDLAGLVSPQSYALAGENDLFSYLAAYGGMDADLIPTETALTTEWVSAATAHDFSPHIGHPGGLVASWCFTYDYIADLSKYRLDQSDKQLKNRVKTANTSPYHYDEKLRNKQMLVMLRGVSPQAHTVGIEQQPGTLVTLTDANGSALASGARTKSGATLTVNVASAAGDFGGLQLVDRFGNVLDTLLTPEAYNLCADEHGIVTLTTSMPYQDCMVRAVVPGAEPAAPADETACTLTGFDGGQLFEAGAVVPFAAMGTSADVLDVPWGTQRLRPAAWNVELLDENGATAVADGTWTGHPFEGALPTDGLDDGMYRLTATFARERLEDGAWVDVGAPYALSRTFTLHDRHVITGPEEEPAEPPSDQTPTEPAALPTVSDAKPLARTGDPLPTATLALAALAAAGAVATCVAFAARRTSRKDRRHDA